MGSTRLLCPLHQVSCTPTRGVCRLQLQMLITCRLQETAQQTSYPAADCPAPVGGAGRDGPRISSSRHTQAPVGWHGAADSIAAPQGSSRAGPASCRPLIRLLHRPCRASGMMALCPTGGRRIRQAALEQRPQLQDLSFEDRPARCGCAFPCFGDMVASCPSGGTTTPMMIDAAQISGPGSAAGNVVPAPTPNAPTQTDNLDNTALAQDGGYPVLATPTADQTAAASTAVDQSATQTPAATAAAVDQSAVQTVADPPSLPTASTTTAAHERAAAPEDDAAASSSSSEDERSRDPGAHVSRHGPPRPPGEEGAEGPRDARVPGAATRAEARPRPRDHDEVEPQPCKHKPARAQTPAQATD